MFVDKIIRYDKCYLKKLIKVKTRKYLNHHDDELVPAYPSPKTNTSRRRHIQLPRLLHQSPVPLIQPPGNDIIGILIRDNQIPPVRRERKVPGPLTAAGVPAPITQPAGIQIDGEDRYAVMPAVG